MATQKITFDTDIIKCMNLFENMTGAKLKDCFFDREKLVFLVEAGEMGKAQRSFLHCTDAFVEIIVGGFIV